MTDRTATIDCCSDPVDAAWGRLPGATPPLGWWLPALVFAVASLVLSLVVILVVRAPGPLDDPHPANQRNGLLLKGPQLPATVGEVSFGGRTVVVLFERRAPTGPDFQRWLSQVRRGDVRVAIAVAGRTATLTLAEAVGIPTPLDGRPPIGYAIVDPARRVRYATLDPSYLRNAFEVNVITHAVEDDGG